MPSQDAVCAVVQKIVKDGKHGPYVVATSESVSGSITFALATGVWLEDYPPEEGEQVCLSSLRKKRAGWKAMTARSVRLSDGFKQPANEEIQQ